MKKILTMCAMVMAAFCVWADTWTDPETGITWTYTVNGNEAIVGGASPVSGSITIPSSLGGREVTTIAEKAFSGNSRLVAVSIPDTVVEIRTDAFEGCDALKTLTLSEGVETIGGYAFGSCAIESVPIPASLTSCAGDAFSQNPIKRFVVAVGNPRYYVSADGNLLLDRIDRKVVHSVAKPGEVTIPEGIVTIGKWAFELVAYTRINFPSTLEVIEYGALNGEKSSVTEFDFSGTSLRRVAPGAFWNENLRRVTFPASLTELCEFAFGFCHSLKEVHFLGAEPEIPGEEDPDVQAALEKMRDKGCSIPEGDRLFMSPAAKWKHCYMLDVTTYVQPGLDWDGIVAFGTWQSRPIKYDGPEPEPEEGFEEAHTFNGLVYAGEVMCGIVQVTTGKRTAKDQVKVGGFVMLADGKKQTIKSVTEDVEGGKLNVETKAGKLGEMELEITDNGFTGTLGVMTVKSGDIGEDTGIISGTLKMSYFDAKTNKLKTRSIKLGGVASEGEAAGTLETKGEADKTFEAAIYSADVAD